MTDDFQTEREKAFNKFHESVEELKAEYVRLIVSFYKWVKKLLNASN